MLRLVCLDGLQLIRERLALMVLIVGLVCAGLAAWNGHEWLSRLTSERSAFLADGESAASAYREKLASGVLTEEEVTLAPVRITLPLAYPMPVLADFTVGRSDIEPSTATVRMRYRSDTLFRKYQIDNPERLARGRLDLSFIVVVIAPLLLILLGYGIFSADRERGVARLILAQAGSPVGLILTRSFNRFLLVAVPIIAAVVVLVLTGPDPQHRMGPAALWLAIAMLGLAFWQSIILLMNSFRIRAETSALALVAIWALLVFVAPAAVGATAQASFPPPSRLALIVESRAAEIAATGDYENDHPELAAVADASQMEQYRRTVKRNYVIGLAIENRVAPILRAFETQLSSQLRFLDALQYVSPPMVLSGALASIAGTDASRYASLRNGARENLATFKSALSEPVLKPRAFSISDYDALPRFTASAESAPPFGAIFFLTMLMGLIGVVSVWRLRRIGCH